MSRIEFGEARRLATSVLTSSERRCLLWLAPRLPGWVNSDHLTVLALLAMMMAGVSYYLARWHPPALLLAVGWLAVNWFGDSLDGTLARVRGHQRPRYGFYVDHVVDCFGVLFLLAGLALSGYMSPLVAMALLVAYFMLVDRDLPCHILLDGLQVVILGLRPDGASSSAGDRHGRLAVSSHSGNSGQPPPSVRCRRNRRNRRHRGRNARRGRSECTCALPGGAVARPCRGGEMTRIAVKVVAGCAAIWIACGSLSAAELGVRTLEAFDRYVRLTEARMERQLGGTAPFLLVDSLPESQRAAVLARLRTGEVVVDRLETREAGSTIDIPAGICHHWSGTVFAAGVPLARTIGAMQAYERYPQMYRPTVRRARTLSRTGDRFNVSMQLFMKKVISVILNVDYDIHYVRIGPTRAYVRSSSTRIAEVQNADTPNEREKPVGQDSGFLWRFNNYCFLEERDRGTYIECESLSLTRDIPSGVGWLVKPFVTGVPKESLEFTLTALRATLVKAED